MENKISARSLLAQVPLWVWGVALTPRLALFVLACIHPEACLPPDGYGYLALAENIFKHQAFIQNEATRIPETFRVPGYPLFLSLIVMVAPSPVLVAALTQCVLGAVTVVLIWLCMRPLAGRLGAGVAASVMALDVVIVLHTPMLLAETLATFLQVVALWITWTGIHSPKKRTIAASGFFWGVLMLVKPVFIYLPLVLCGLWVRRGTLFFIFLAAASLAPAVWIARNAAVADFRGLTTQAGFDLLKYPAASVEAMATGRPVEDLQRELQARVDAEHASGYATQAEQSTAYAQAAARVMKAHPRLAVRYAALGMVKILAGTGAALWLFYIPGAQAPDVGWSLSIFSSAARALVSQHPVLLAIQLIYMIFLGILYLLSFIGCLRLARSGRWVEVFLLAAGALYFLAVSSFQGYSRFRIPMMPFMAAAAAMALAPAKKQKES